MPRTSLVNHHGFNGSRWFGSSLQSMKINSKNQVSMGVNSAKIQPIVTCFMSSRT